MNDIDMTSSSTKTIRLTNGVIAARAATPAPSPGPTNEQIAGYLNIGIWGVFLLLVLVSLPRAYSRYRHPTGRSDLRLRRGGGDTTRTIVAVERQGSEISHDDDSPIKEKMEESTYEVAPPVSPLETAPIPTSNGPTHSRVASFASIFHKAHRYLSRPFWFTPYSILQALCFACYTTLIVFGILYHNLPSFGPRRAGWMVVGQLPLVVSLGTKNSIVAFLLGVGYEKLNVWHRWVGRTIFLSALFHVTGYLVLFTKKGTLSTSVTHVPEGWITLSGLCMLAIFSMPQVRRSVYTLFWHCHWIGYCMMLIGVSFHAEHAWHYATAAAGLIVIDHVCRLYRTHFVTAKITAIPELQCTRIEVSHLTKGWRAGQHVRLWAISSRMGFIKSFEPHPFTIATVSESSSEEGLVLYAKKAGDWTKRLYDVAHSTRADIGGEAAGVGASTIRMVLEGPYGGPGHDVLSSFTSAFMVLGGSGITFGLSTIDELIREAENSVGKTRLIELVWVIQDPTSLLSLLPVFQSFLDRVARVYPRTGLEMQISVHYTRASPIQVNIPESQPNIVLVPGRPNLNQMLDRLVDRTASSGQDIKRDLHGVVVGCCGPEGLRESVSRAARSVSGKTRKAVAGVELVEEMFGW